MTISNIEEAMTCAVTFEKKTYAINVNFGRYQTNFTGKVNFEHGSYTREFTVSNADTCVLDKSIVSTCEYDYEKNLDVVLVLEGVIALELVR